MRHYLRDIAEIGAGQGAPQGDHNYCESGVPFIKAGNLHELITGGSINDIQKVSDEVAKTYKLKLYPRGTVLFAKSGMSCLKGYVYILPMAAYVVNHLACITPKEDISEYLRLYFTYHRPNQLVKDAAYPSISLADIGNLEIDTKDKQTRDHLISVLKSVEGMIELRKQEMQKLDDLIKARFVEMFGDPSLNTKRHPVKSLAEIAEYWNGLTYKPEDVANEGTIVLRSSNIQNAQLDFEDTVRVTCNIGEKKFVQDNDILMCSRNGSARLVGKVALIKDIEEPMSFGAFMMIIRSHYYPYLMTYFQMPAFRAQITTGATTTINQITGRMLDNIMLPVPEESELASFISFMEQVDKSKVVVQKALDEAQLLFDSLMQKYFG